MHGTRTSRILKEDEQEAYIPVGGVICHEKNSSSSIDSLYNDRSGSLSGGSLGDLR